MIEFLFCPVEIIVREALIPLEAGSRKSGPLRLVTARIRSHLRKGPARMRGLWGQKPPQTRPHASQPSAPGGADPPARIRRGSGSDKTSTDSPMTLRRYRTK